MAPGSPSVDIMYLISAIPAATVSTDRILCTFSLWLPSSIMAYVLIILRG